MLGEFLSRFPPVPCFTRSGRLLRNNRGLSLFYSKCGNGRARRLLVEAAHCYRYPAKVSTELQTRQEGLPKEVIDQAWVAQQRLCRRYQRLLQRGKPYNVIVTAIAREIIAYIWSISKEVVLPKVDPAKRLARVPA